MKLEHVCCDLCGSDDYSVRYRKPDDFLWLNYFEYPVVECQNCGLVYVNPRPTFDEMGAFYPKGYHDGRDDASHLERYQFQFEYISRLDFSTVLDIGCARGDWLDYIQKQRPQVELHGVDAFSDGVCNPLISFRRCPLYEAKLPEDYFDLVTAWAVLEHVHTPSAYFEVVSKVLRPGGKFVFLVTNSESIYGKYAYKEDIPRHLYHFNERSLSAYAKQHGLQLERIAYDARFWDGTGKGAFRHAAARLLRLSWRDRHLGKAGFLSKVFLKLASFVDNVVFCYDWEAIARRSGIIVVTMSRDA